MAACLKTAAKMSLFSYFAQRVFLPNWLSGGSVQMMRAAIAGLKARTDDIGDPFSTDSYRLPHVVK